MIPWVVFAVELLSTANRLKLAMFTLNAESRFGTRKISGLLGQTPITDYSDEIEQGPTI